MMTTWVFVYKKKRVKMSEGKEDERKVSTCVSTAASPAVFWKSLDDWNSLFLKVQFVIFRLSESAVVFQTDPLHKKWSQFQHVKNINNKKIL